MGDNEMEIHETQASTGREKQAEGHHTEGMGVVGKIKVKSLRNTHTACIERALVVSSLMSKLLKKN